MKVIETCALSRRYRRTWALGDWNLTIPAGPVVALVGPNGAGKTTLLFTVVQVRQAGVQTHLLVRTPAADPPPQAGCRHQPAWRTGPGLPA